MIPEPFVPRHLVPLATGTSFTRPAELPELVRLDSPATDVMTDFEVVRPVTVRPDVPIDRALDGMKRAGVRLLLVTDADEQVVGLITANDIQGEKPIKLMEEMRLDRGAITVRMIMIPQPEIVALDLRSVVDSQVGHIIATLDKLEQQHVLVIEADSQTGRQRVRGLFSTSQISRQLGEPIGADLHAAHSLGEMVLEIA